MSTGVETLHLICIFCTTLCITYTLWCLEYIFMCVFLPIAYATLSNQEHKRKNIRHIYLYRFCYIFECLNLFLFICYMCYLY